MIKVFVNTWGNYNTNGADFGEWLYLPMDMDDLEDTLKEIAENMGDGSPEWFINDYETNGLGIEIDENEDIFELNNLAERLENLDNYDREVLEAIIEATGYNVKEAIENIDNCIYYSGMSLEEVAEEIIKDCYDLPEFALRYFDYEAFARDLGFDGYTETSTGVIYVG